MIIAADCDSVLKPRRIPLFAVRLNDYFSRTEDDQVCQTLTCCADLIAMKVA